MTDMLDMSSVNSAFNQPINNCDTSSEADTGVVLTDNSVVDDRDNFCVTIKRADVANSRGCADAVEVPGRRTGFVLLSDFAGIDLPGLGLAGLGVLQEHFAFEIDPIARKFILDHFAKVSLFGLVLDRVSPMSVELTS